MQIRVGVWISICRGYGALIRSFWLQGFGTTLSSREFYVLLFCVVLKLVEQLFGFVASSCDGLVFCGDGM